MDASVSVPCNKLESEGTSSAARHNLTLGLLVVQADSNFVGKGVLLQWLNTNLALKLEKIEDTCNGAVACQLIDCLHPGSINMKKVDFNVRNDYEFVGNYKVLQEGFTKSGVKKEFNVSSLSKGKFQDNCEFMQWFKGYWDEVTGGQDITDYDPVGRRQLCKTGDWKKYSLGASAAPRISAAGTIPAIRRSGSSAGSEPAVIAMPSKRGGSMAVAPASKAQPKPAAVPEVDDSMYRSQLAELNDQVTELKLKVETVERERDFYFDKLRDIEILCQAPELQSVPVVKIFEKILYAADAAEAKEAMQEAQQFYGAELSPEHLVPQEAQ
ncbi:hypothetical protein N2152v2_011233 [Parachlorella kessleri]